MITMPPYCPDVFAYRRRTTRVVMVGDVGIGGDHPIRIQSMTISDTMDTAATVAETIQLAEAGCELVRITAPSLNEAENLKYIKAELQKQGIHVPLIADIHFTPNAAMKAVEYVEKVRINPGNYCDKKKFAEHEYSDSEYQAELERIETRFKPLVLKAKQYGVAMRIGTNHGSLSDRIMNRFGDTPQGMVESALEFVRICQRHDYHNIVLSMKASNPLVMIQAYRLLAARMQEEGMDYPFHLGVTEAGDGEEGRIKSAVGIGTLLEDGIGDTIRVSLTEDSVYEIPAAYAIAGPYNTRLAAPPALPPVRLPTVTAAVPVEHRNPYGYTRRPSHEMTLGALGFGGSQPVRVELATTVPLHDTAGTLAQIHALTTPATPNAPVAEIVRLQVATPADLEAFAVVQQQVPDVLYALQVPIHLLQTRNTLPAVAKLVTIPHPATDETTWRAEVQHAVTLAQHAGAVVEWALSLESLPTFLQQVYGCTLTGLAHTAALLVQQQPHGVLLSLDVAQPLYAYRLLAAHVDQLGLAVPLHLKTAAFKGRDDTLFKAPIQLGALLCDGLGDSLQIASDLPPTEAISMSYNILQAARLRMSKTEFISCPSCGRTLFNLQTTTERIKAQMSHLKDVKIAIMGCIVNGPGEMADADFGYVGAGPGKISLYVGKECVERNIPEKHADERLIQLIQQHDKWVEPVS